MLYEGSTERSVYSPIKASNNAPDEYVILDKITRFRQDYQMSAIIKLVPRFGENSEYRIPWPLPLY